VKGPLRELAAPSSSPAVIGALGRTHRAPVARGWPRLQERSRNGVSSPFYRSHLWLKPNHHLDGLHHRLSRRQRRIRRHAFGRISRRPATIIHDSLERRGWHQAAAEIPPRFPLPPPIVFGYTGWSAVVVVGGATVRPFVTEPSTMLVIRLVLSIACIGFFCWLLFTFAVYALPFFGGLTAGLAAFHSGLGIIGALVVGVLAARATLAIGQIAFATVRTPLIRAAIVLLFAVPAAVAGCHATFGLAQIGVPSEGWPEAFASRRCPCRWHGVGAHVAACPAACRSSGSRRSGIVPTGQSDPGRVSPRRPHRRSVGFRCGECAASA